MPNDKGFLFSGPFFTLKVIFVDLLLACCRLASEVNQGLVLFATDQNRIYGIVTFGIIWIPGLTFAVHILSVNRREWVWYRTIISAACSILFYPIAPILAILNFLWMKPSDNKRRSLFASGLREAQYGSTITQAIHGGIASPIQLCYQLWLSLNGVVSFADNIINFSSFNLKDWEGNQITVPFAAPVCIFFSTIT